MDSDIQKKKKELFSELSEHSILLSTYSGIGMIHASSIDVVAFALFESDLTIPEYRMEENSIIRCILLNILESEF